MAECPECVRCLTSYEATIALAEKPVPQDPQEVPGVHEGGIVVDVVLLVLELVLLSTTLDDASTAADMSVFAPGRTGLRSSLSARAR